MARCKSHPMNPMQRRFLLLFSVTLIITSALFSLANLPGRSVTALGSFRALDVLPIIPFLIMMVLIPRYLSREKDEFIRGLVVRALLWGFAVPMVVDTIWGCFWRVFPPNPILPIINIDLFLFVALFGLLGQIRRYQ